MSHSDTLNDSITSLTCVSYSDTLNNSITSLTRVSHLDTMNDSITSLTRVSHSDTMNDSITSLTRVSHSDILNDKDERKDVNREFVVLLKVFDENHTWHTSENLHKCGKSEKCQKLLEKGDHDFLASNYMHALNGYMYAHGAPFSVCGGDKVVWHVLGFGGQLDLHSFTVDGESLTVGPER